MAKLFEIGTKAQFNTLKTKDENMLYWLTDSQELYKGSTRYAIGKLATEDTEGLMSAEDKQLLNMMREMIATANANGATIATASVGVGEGATFAAYASPVEALEGPAIPAVMDMAEFNGVIAAYDGWEKDKVNYPWYGDDVERNLNNQYFDENYSRIDGNKNISVDKGQLNLSQESHAQFIPFEMNRYYDGIDLSRMTISMIYKNKSNKAGKAKIVNMQYGADKIRFAWLVDGSVTQEVGNLTFEVQARGFMYPDGGEWTSPDGQVTDKGGAYIWKSRVGSGISVIQSLDFNENDWVEFEEGWMDELVSQIANTVALEITKAGIDAQVTAANDAANRATAAAATAESQVQLGLAGVNQRIDGVAGDVELLRQTTNLALSDVNTRITNEVATVNETIEVQIDSVNTKITNTNTRIDNANTRMDGIDSKITEVKDSIPTKVGAFENDKEYVTNGELTNALGPYAKKTDLPTKVGDLANDQEYTTKTYVADEIAKIDVTSQLGDYALKSDLNGLASETYVQEEIAKVDVSEQLVEYAKTEEVNAQIGEVQTQVNTNKNDISTLSTKVSNNETNIGNLTSNATTLSTKVSDLENIVRDMGDQVGYEYEATYGKTTLEATGEETDNVFTLYEIDGEQRSVKSQFIITGGSGGGSAAATTLTITRITPSPLTITTSDKAIVKFNCTSVDGDGETVDCSYSWKKGSSIIMSGSLEQGENTFDLTQYVTTGTHKFTLTVTDEGGSMSVKTWTIQMIDVRLESTFNDKVVYDAGKPVSFTYTPYGAISKTIHFKLDGIELEPVVTSASGLLQSYTLPAQAHGAHLLEVWITTDNEDINPPHIYKDIIWRDSESDIPIIGCIYRYDHYGMVAARQYNAIDIPYVVIDPAAENPTITRYVDGESVGTLTLEGTSDTWSYKSSEIGEKVLTIECGATSVEVKLDVAELGITIEPVVANMAFDFNPAGRSNNDTDRIWSDTTTGVTMSVSDNFDWTNGGYQRDENGDTYFCVKAGTTATINYNLFGDAADPKGTGKEFKFVFKTTNVKNRSGTFLSCIDGETPIGIDMKVESAKIYASNKELFIPYCEEDIIEFEFNINKDEDIPMVMTYEDGVANRPLIYASDSSFMQQTAQPITIGSADCDVHVYRVKAYETSLSDKEILTNFIADARNADEMIARYNRNQIYDENNALTPETLAEKCPDLRIIMIDAPWFTNDKDDKVGGTTIRQIYKGGDAVLDNWTCTGAKHSGQGTSSNKYGYAGRNIRLIMNEDESLFTFNGTNEDGTPITGKTITLTRDSVPNAFYNIKVNIASSENQNNAQFARRYNEFNPVIRAAKANDPKVKDTMEFYNCVVFIRENDTDLTKHREFNDTQWHFYAIGNIGDDKKTDKSRVNDSKDPKEFILEIKDYDVPLAEFPTGIGGRYIAPDQFVAGNKAYDYLYSAYTYDEEGKFATFGAESYEFRYEMKGITDEQRQVNIDAWREFYKFVVTSTDEEFVANFENYFILDSALYYYLFTERYLMVDNRAKNCFLHRGKVYISEEEAVVLGDKAKNYIIDNDKAAINEGYRLDLCFAYDMDTSLGIDNTGKLVLTYGQEDIDKDASGSYIYRAAESNFFCKVRDLFPDRLKGMFQSCESLGAWSATSLINQWDEAQNQFPEELWRHDVERKYIRTYKGESLDNSIVPKDDNGNPLADPMFLEPMLNGRKRYQRRQIERNNELYFATKYISTVAKNNFIRLRFNNPTNAVVKQDYTIYLTPYTDMYLGVAYGNTDPVHFRAKAGIEYTIQRDTESATADIIEIYGASFIQAIGDLSKCYLGDNSFAMATRLQRLVIGSDVEGYENTFMTKLSLGNNKLLEYLDIRNITGFVKAEGQKDPVIDLSGCSNLLELHAEGAGITGVIFANGGQLEKAYLPAITSLTMKNLDNLKVLDIAGYNQLQKLIAENIHSINTHAIVDAATALNTVRLIGINWPKELNIQDTAILSRLYKMRGIDNNGYENNKSVVTGYIWVINGKDREIGEFNKLWPYLTIDAQAILNQYKVTFKNDDGTILDVQYVDKGSQAVDPITRADNPIPTPTKESTVSTKYTFKSWNENFTDIFGDKDYYATYTEEIREYTVKYVSKGKDMQVSTAKYGEVVSYTGDIPTYTAEEGAYNYYLFKGWDKSGYVDGDKTIEAQYDSFGYYDGCFGTYEEPVDFGTLTPVQFYCMIKMGMEKYFSNAVNDVIPFKLGNDYSYSDILEQVLIENDTKFNGVSDKIVIDEKLFSEEKDFVLAIDYTADKNVAENGVIMQCWNAATQKGIAIKNNGTDITFNLNASIGTISSKGKRNIVIIRYLASKGKVYIYNSNAENKAAINNFIEFDITQENKHENQIVFGCGTIRAGNRDEYANFAACTIHWAKIWRGDLGQADCESLAIYPHENLDLCVTGDNGLYRYPLSDGSGNSTYMSFITKMLLSNEMAYNQSSGYNTWDNARIKTYLDNKVYKAIPILWRQLIKKTQIGSLDIPTKQTTANSGYLVLPAYADVYTITEVEWKDKYESENMGSKKGALNIFTNNDSRKASTSAGDVCYYYTRTPNIEQDSNSNATGWMYAVTTDGSMNGFIQGNSLNYQNKYPMHIRFIFSI